MATVHLTYGNESLEYNTDELDLGDEPTDVQVIDALSNQAGIPAVKLRALEVSRNDSGDITVYPRATFGNK